MIPSTQSPERAFVEAIERWLALLAAGRIGEACAQLDEPNSYGIRWSEEMILALVRDTFPPQSGFGREHPEGPVFTLPSKRSCDSSFTRATDGTYFVEHPMHLNGGWSDLTAQFEFLPRDGGWAMVLHDLHVL